MVKEMISDGTGNSVELEGEGDGDTLEVSLHFSTTTTPTRSFIYFSCWNDSSVCLCAPV